MDASPRELAGFARSFEADLRRWGGAAALASFALNLVWLACFVTLARVGDLAAQVALRPAVFRLSVGACLVITLCQIPVAAAMAWLAWERARGRAVTGALISLLYVPSTRWRTSPSAAWLPSSSRQALPRPRRRSSPSSSRSVDELGSPGTSRCSGMGSSVAAGACSLRRSRPAALGGDGRLRSSRRRAWPAWQGRRGASSTRRGSRRHPS